MTDDIVARLRLRNDPSMMLMCYPPRPAPDMLCYEAADRIEQLENQISHIIEHNNPQMEKANSYFKALEEELAKCNKIIDGYEEEHSELRADNERLRAALHEWDALIEHQYSGSREAMSDMTYAAQRTAHLLYGDEPWPEPRRAALGEASDDAAT